MDDSLAEPEEDDESRAKVLEKVIIIINDKNKTQSFREEIIACDLKYPSVSLLSRTRLAREV